MIKKILVAQDGSAFGGAALEYGIWCARKFGASLCGIHVIDIVSLEGPFLHDLSASIGFEPNLNFAAKMREILDAKSADILDFFEEECEKGGVECETVATVGLIAKEISAHAKTADLVVMGTRGVNEEFERGLVGSVTEGVLRGSSKPVLVVPRKFKAPEKMMLAYDSTPHASKAMNSAAEWATALGLPLTVVSVSVEEGSDEFLNEAKDYLKSYKLGTEFVQLIGDPPALIEEYYRENAFDLLFMGVTSHSRVVEMIFGSTTGEVMRGIDGPCFIER